MRLTDALVFLGRDLTLDPFRHADIDTLRRMLDKYGFARAVVCSFHARTEALERDHAVVFAAARADARLIPCPVVVPDSAGEVGNEAAFVDSLIARGARAAALYPVTWGTSLDERIVGPLLNALQARCLPLYLFETPILAARDVADRHPGLPIVLHRPASRDRIWLRTLLDTPNLYVSLAPNFCPWRGVENLVQGGAGDRILLASAFPEAEPGAPLGQIFSAEAPDETVAAVCSDNLERLLSRVLLPDASPAPLPPAPAPPAPAWRRQGLAAHIGRREPLPLQGIVDMHGHIGHSHRFAVSRAHGAGIVAEMDRLGIQSMLVSHETCMSWDVGWGNDEVLQAMAAHPGRILGYAVCYAGDTPPGVPSQTALAEVRRCIEAGMMGIKLHISDGVSYSDGRYAPIWEYAEANGLPVLLHTWGKIDSLEPVFERCPTAPVILGHSGAGSGPAPYVDMARRHGNVYLEICWSAAPWGYVEEFVGRLGAARVLFGSDGTWFSAGHQLARVLFADIPEEDKRAILVENPARILKRL